jgi:hypothetical protein
MSRSLSPYPNMDALRGEPKRWLKAIAAGDSEAISCFRRVFPDYSDVPSKAAPTLISSFVRRDNTTFVTRGSPWTRIRT